MTWFVESMRQYPELALFLTLALGALVGMIKIGSFKVGSVTGVLLVGVLVGQLNIEINSTVKAVFFLLFLFALGYKAGPQFFKGLKKEGLPQVLFAIIVCVVGLISVVAVGKVLGYNAGQAGGLAAGALTQSATIGVAQDAINKLAVDATMKKTMTDFVPVGYAVTYIFGTIGAAFVLSTIGPKLLGVDLEEECRKMESADEKVVTGHGIYSGMQDVEYRAFKLAEYWNGKTVSQFEKEVINGDVRLFVVRVKQNNKVTEANESTVLTKDDSIVVSFPSKKVGLVKIEKIGTEISDFALLNFPIEKLNIVVKEDKIVNKSIKDIRTNILARGAYVYKVEEKGQEVEFSNETVIKKKDVVAIAGPKDVVEKLAKDIGKPARDSSDTDVVFLGLGVFLGGLIGIPAIVINGISLSLSTSGGALILGLIFGFIHSRRPNIGLIPEATVSFLSNVGLQVFVAVVGIVSGPGFVSGLKESGISFFFAGIIVTIVPLIVGILLGKYVFKWKAPIILGAVAGAMTTTAAIGAITEKAKSDVPVLGYTIPYAVGNILLTVWGSIVIIFFG